METDGGNVFAAVYAEVHGRSSSNEDRLAEMAGLVVRSLPRTVLLIPPLAVLSLLLTVGAGLSVMLLSTGVPYPEVVLGFAVVLAASQVWRAAWVMAARQMALRRTCKATPVLSALAWGGLGMLLVFVGLRSHQSFVHWAFPHLDAQTTHGLTLMLRLAALTFGAGPVWALAPALATRGATVDSLNQAADRVCAAPSVFLTAVVASLVVPLGLASGVIVALSAVATTSGLVPTLAAALVAWWVLAWLVLVQVVILLSWWRTHPG